MSSTQASVAVHEVANEVRARGALEDWHYERHWVPPVVVNTDGRAEPRSRVYRLPPTGRAGRAGRDHLRTTVRVRSSAQRRTCC
jgi:hypothetical protein